MPDTRTARVSGQPEVGHAADVDLVVRAVPDAERSPSPSPLGLAAEQLDRAADRVLAGQRALRAAQDLHAVEVHQLEQRARQRGDVDVVDIDADARIERVVEVGLADAADERDEARAAVLRLRPQRTFGACVATWVMSVWPRASSIAALTAVIAIGVSCRLAERNSAVTTMSCVRSGASSVVPVCWLVCAGLVELRCPRRCCRWCWASAAAGFLRLGVSRR